MILARMQVEFAGCGHRGRRAFARAMPARQDVGTTAADRSCALRT